MNESELLGLLLAVVEGRLEHVSFNMRACGLGLVLISAIYILRPRRVLRTTYAHNKPVVNNHINTSRLS